MTTLTSFVCAALIVLEIVFVPLYLKKMWPTKTWQSLGIKMVCATDYLLVAVTAVISYKGLNVFSAMMLTGFVASWLGDLMLHIPKPTKKFFVIGMLFFMTAHIFYCMAYIRIQCILPDGMPVFSAAEIISALVIVAACFTFCFIKKIRFDTLFVPCLVYGFFVTMMMIKSANIGLRLLNNGGYTVPAVLLIIGGICFFLSDLSLALISFDTRYKKFKLKVFNSVTYFGAQVCLALTLFFFSAI